jgi:hypothetical protein
VRRTEKAFERHGARSLLVAKFVPGLQTAAPPLAGVFRLPVARFLAWDAAGALLWAGAFVGAGALFHDQLEWLLGASGLVGRGLLALLVGALAAYWLWKVVQRRRFFHALRIARIEPAEVARRIAAGEPVQVVDLREPIDRVADPRTVPGALAIRVEEIAARHPEIARDRDIVLFCT